MTSMGQHTFDTFLLFFSFYLFICYVIIYLTNEYNNHNEKSSFFPLLDDSILVVADYAARRLVTPAAGDPIALFS